MIEIIREESGKAEKQGLPKDIKQIGKPDIGDRIYVENQVYEEALDEFQKATTFEFSNTAGTNSYEAYYQIGRILNMAGEKKMAVKYFELCGDFPPAIAELSKLNESPDCS